LILPAPFRVNRGKKTETEVEIDEEEVKPVKGKKKASKSEEDDTPTPKKAKGVKGAKAAKKSPAKKKPVEKKRPREEDEDVEEPMEDEDAESVETQEESNLPAKKVRKLSTKRVLKYAEEAEMISIDSSTYHTVLKYALKFGVIARLMAFDTDHLLKITHLVNETARQYGIEPVKLPEEVQSQVDSFNAVKVESVEPQQVEESNADTKEEEHVEQNETPMEETTSV
jgi:hypothetical protein